VAIPNCLMNVPCSRVSVPAVSLIVIFYKFTANTRRAETTAISHSKLYITDLRLLTALRLAKTEAIRISL
jgi:hypothetical protein